MSIELQITKANAFHTEIDLPHSKSILNRLLMMHAYQSEPFEMDIHAESSDVRVLFKAIYNFDETIDFKDAGTPLRFFLVYAAFKNIQTEMTGSERLRERPIHSLLEALESLGAKFQYMDKPYHLPLKLTQALDPSKSDVSLDANVSSQFVSALLLAAPYFDKGLSIRLQNQAVSMPYIEMTVVAMKQAGVDVDFENLMYSCEPGIYQNLNAVELERDWSSAAFVLGLTTCVENVDLKLKGLSLKSTQGDAEIVKFFEKFGINFIEHADGVQVVRKQVILPISVDIDFTNKPDAFPVIASVCAYHKIKAVFKGVQNLKHKESNRIEAMKFNLNQMGCDFIMDGNDVLELVHNDVPLNTLYLNSFQDHRIAMACAMFAFKTKVVVDDPSCVEKSFPTFWSVLSQLIH